MSAAVRHNAIRAVRAVFRAAAFLLCSGLLATLGGCSARAPRTFSPATEDEAQRSVEAWKQAVARAEGVKRARLLYDAHLTQGLAKLPGTLAVEVTSSAIGARLTGPFGSPVAVYSEGSLRGEKIKPIAIEPADLKALLAGVWKAADPQVRGVNGPDALLHWEGHERVDAVIDREDATFRSLTITRLDAMVMATYSGPFDPWPSRVELQDAASGGRLRLRLLSREALP